jgi:hypothetical protein
MLPTHHSPAPVPNPAAPEPPSYMAGQQHGREASASTNGSSEQGHTFVGSIHSTTADKPSAKGLSPDSDGSSAGRRQQQQRGEYEPPRPSYLEPLDPALGSGGESSDADSDLGTATETDDEFDWDLSDGAEGADGAGQKGETAESIAKGGLLGKGQAAAGGTTTGKHRARRGRKLYIWLMGLSRWFRTLLVACAGAAILITPFVVVISAYRDNYARTQVQVWYAPASFSGIRVTCRAEAFRHRSALPRRSQEYLPLHQLRLWLRHHCHRRLSPASVQYVSRRGLLSAGGDGC